MMSVEDAVRTTDTLGRDLQVRRETFELKNSTVIAEYGPVGVVLRVERSRGATDYAGPFADPEGTLSALSEVSQG